MKIGKIICAAMSVLFAFAFCARADGVGEKGKKGLDVMAVYYPHWHVHPEGESWKGAGWTEWEVVKTAIPRYSGHNQPLRPTMGYLDSADPADVAKEIEMASNHGIDIFLYDWYWHSGVKTMEEGLENGFLKAANKDKMKFALMWANHDRVDGIRAKLGGGRKVSRSQSYSEEDFKNMISYCAAHYFRESNYYKPNGKLFFSIYSANDFIKGMGGAEKVKKAFAEVDANLVKQGLPPVHWNAMTNDPEGAVLAKEAGFESTSAYNIGVRSVKGYAERLKKGEWTFDYSEVADGHRAQWKSMSDHSPLPNNPIVTRGWDTTPRCRPDEKFPFWKVEYPYRPIAVNNTPDKYETLLRDARDYAAADPKKPFAILINAWNEYTEGCYLVPDMREGMGSLQAMANVFGRTPKDKFVFAGHMEGGFDPKSHGKIVDSFPVPSIEDISYGPHWRQRMFVWLAKADKPTPVMIIIHGGGWTNGARLDSRSEGMIKELLKNGISVVSAEYRWIQDAVHDGVNPPLKAPLEDAARIVQFVRFNAKAWNIDPSRIGLTGGSAGGCSSLWVALHKDMANPESSDPVARESSRVKLAAVAVPQTSLDPKQMREWTPNMNYGYHTFGYKNFDAWLADRDNIMPFINEYSPYANISKGNPVMLHLTYSDSPDVGKPQKDPTHGANLGFMFKKRCDELGVKCDVVYGKGAAEARQDFILKNLP